MTASRKGFDVLTYTILFAYLAVLLLPVRAEPPRRMQWTWGPVMPAAKSCRATAAVGHSVVTVGGTAWETLENETKVKRWLRCAYRLDVGATHWAALPDYPFAAGYGFAAAVGNEIYVCGGRGTKRGNAETFVLDLAKESASWEPGPALPLARWAHVGGVIDGVVYIAGGVQGDPGPGGETMAAPDVLALDTGDIAAGWTKVAGMPSLDLEWPVAAATDGRLFLFGGMRAGVPIAEAFALDPGTGRWTPIHPLPLGLGSGAAVAIGDGAILVSGGSALAVPAALTPDGKVRNIIAANSFLYHVRQDSYQTVTPLLQATLDQGLVHINGTVVSIGGEDSPYKTRSDLVQIGTLR